MKTFNIEISGKTFDDIITAITEISKRIKLDNEMGYYDNTNMSFSFNSEGYYEGSIAEEDGLDDFGNPLPGNVCKKCGQAFINHNGDGSYVSDEDDGLPPDEDLPYDGDIDWRSMFD